MTFPSTFMTPSISLRRLDAEILGNSGRNSLGTRRGAAALGDPSVRPTPFLRQHLVHHLAGKPEIGARVAHLLELRAREMPGDIGILRQQIDQPLAARRDLAADVVDEVVRPLAT